MPRHFQEEWQYSTLVRRWRAGQAQHGVDIVGRDRAILPAGIQCKKKSGWLVKRVATTDLHAEVEEVKKFKPRVKAFYSVPNSPMARGLQVPAGRSHA